MSKDNHLLLERIQCTKLIELFAACSISRSLNSVAYGFFADLVGETVTAAKNIIAKTVLHDLKLFCKQASDFWV
jgi:hypothetical protein